MKHCCRSESSCRQWIHYFGSVYFIQFAIGAMFFFGGIKKWTGGLGGFAEKMSEGFAESFVPVSLVFAVLWILPILETVIGAWLVSGYERVYSLYAANKLLSLLLLGHLLKGDGCGGVFNLIVAIFIVTYAFNISLKQQKKGGIMHVMEEKMHKALETLS